MSPPPQDEMDTASPPSSARGAKIFVNYRREDASGYAGRLYEWLSDRFGPDRVFMDISAIEPGADFVAAIEHQVAACEVALVVVGRQWLNCAVDGQRRLDNPSDYVRLEIASALAGNVHVIPVLVDGASMPRERDLPDDLKPLARRQALEISDARWDFDVGRLIHTLEARMDKRRAGKGARQRAKVRPPGRANLRGYWQLFPVRLVVGLLVLAVTLLPQWYLISRPQPLKIEDTGWFSPAESKLGSRELMIGGPVTNSDEGLLFAHVGKANEIVDLSIEWGRLNVETLRQLGDFNPPSTATTLDYLTTNGGGRAEGEPCRTSLKISADPQKPPTSLHFYQTGEHGDEGRRSLKMKATGAELLINKMTAVPYGSTEQALCCRKLLKVGTDFELPTVGTYNVGMIAQKGSASSFSFSPAKINTSLWDGADGLFAPFDLGSEQIDPNGAPPFRARSVEIRPLGNESSDPIPILSAQSLEGGELLTIEGLKVGSDRLQISVSGRGMVKKDGINYVDHLDRIKTHPLPASLLALFDSALIIWFMRLLFSRHQPVMQ